MHVVVIGAGIVGVTVAYRLLREGHSITIVEPENPGGEHAASYGNGGWLSPSLVVPLSMPGLWKKIPQYLLDPKGPLTIDPMQLPRLAPWLIRFLASGHSFERVSSTARALRPLVDNCHELHWALASEVGAADLIERNGQLQVYRDRADFTSEALAWRLRGDNGGTWDELDQQELRAAEPGLHSRYNFGIRLTGYNCISPGRYVEAIFDHVRQMGASVRRTAAIGFHFEGAKLVGVVTKDGEIACDKAVVCAGVHSKALAAQAGDAVMLEAERGYHVILEDLPRLPNNRVLLMDGRMTNTPSRFGLRVTGHVEFKKIDAAPNWKRAEILRDFTTQSYPGLFSSSTKFGTKFWMGARPSTPDGKAVIGQSRRSEDVTYAFGHGHIGVASAPMTAQLVTDLIAGRPARFDINPFSPRRF